MTLGGQNGANILSESVPIRNAASAPAKYATATARGTAAISLNRIAKIGMRALNARFESSGLVSCTPPAPCFPSRLATGVFFAYATVEIGSQLWRRIVQNQSIVWIEPQIFVASIRQRGGPRSPRPSPVGAGGPTRRQSRAQRSRASARPELSGRQAPQLRAASTLPALLRSIHVRGVTGEPLPCSPPPVPR